MASLKSSRPSSYRGDKSSLPHDPLHSGELNASHRSTFKGHRWVVAITYHELDLVDSVRDCYEILDSIFLGLPKQCCWAINMRGLVVSMALYLAMLSMGFVLLLTYVRCARFPRSCSCLTYAQCLADSDGL